MKCHVILCYSEFWRIPPSPVLLETDILRLTTCTVHSIKYVELSFSISIVIISMLGFEHHKGLTIAFYQLRKEYLLYNQESMMENGKKGVLLSYRWTLVTTYYQWKILNSIIIVNYYYSFKLFNHEIQFYK